MIGGSNGGEAAVEDIDFEALEEEPEEDDESDLGEDAFDFLKQYTPLGLLGLAGSRGGGRGGGGRYYQPPVAPFVTQSQLRRSLASVRRDVRGVSTRVNAVQAATTRVARDVAAQRKTSAHHAKLIKGLRSELNQTREMSMIMPLLMQPKSLEPTTGPATIGHSEVPIGASLQYQTGDSSPLLWALLLPSMFGQQGGSEGGFGSNMGVVFLLLAVTGGLKF
jgi:hypothetical protein